MSGLLNADAGIAIDTNKFTVATNGNTLIAGTLDANSTADIADTLTLSKGTGTGLSVTSNATVGGSLTVSGDASMAYMSTSGYAVFNGDVAVADSNTLTVGTGATTLGGALTVSGDASMADVSTSGYATFNGTVAVAGSNTFTVGTGATTLGGALTVSGDASMADISTSGYATFNGDVNISGSNNLTLGSGTFTTSGSLSLPDSSVAQRYIADAYNMKTSYTFTVASKTSVHLYYNQGSSSGYFVDGIESPVLTLRSGVTYTFDNSDSTNSGHPLLFYYDSGKTSAYTTGVTTTGTAGSSGASVELVVSASTPTKLYYQCSAHSLMGTYFLIEPAVENVTLTELSYLEGVTSSIQTQISEKFALDASNNIDLSSYTYGYIKQF